MLSATYGNNQKGDPMTDEEAFEKWNEQSDPCDPERATELINLMQAVLRQAFIAGRESARAENSDSDPRR